MKSTHIPIMVHRREVLHALQTPVHDCISTTFDRADMTTAGGFRVLRMNCWVEKADKFIFDTRGFNVDEVRRHVIREMPFVNIHRFAVGVKAQGADVACLTVGYQPPLRGLDWVGCGNDLMSCALLALC